MLRLLAVGIVLQVVFAEEKPVNFTDCSGFNNVKELYLDPGPDHPNQRCTLKSKTKLKVRAKYVPVSTVHAAYDYYSARVGTSNLYLPVVTPIVDACSNEWFSHPCPLEEQIVVEYERTVTLQRYPKSDVWVRYQLLAGKSPRSKVLACVHIACTTYP